jgi:hypothetical protein
MGSASLPDRLIPGESVPVSHLTGCWKNPRPGLDAVGDLKIFCLVMSGTTVPCSSVHDLVTIPTELSRSLHVTCSLSAAIKSLIDQLLHGS